MRMPTKIHGAPRDATQDAQFRTSSYCSDAGSCVEIATDLEIGAVLVRHSDGGDAIAFSRDEWRAFVAGVKNGEFDA